MKKVVFGMFWQCYGQQCVELPEEIDPNDVDAVREYIKSIWDDIPIPAGEYIADSDEFDPNYMVIINQ